MGVIVEDHHLQELIVSVLVNEGIFNCTLNIVHGAGTLFTSEDGSFERCL